MEKYHSGAIWEKKFAYSRAIKKGNIIEFSGTTSILNGELIHKGDAYKQAIRIFEIIKEGLEYFGAEMDHVTRTRIFVTNRFDYKDVAKAHGEVFEGIDPATSLLVGVQFIDPDMLVEIEVTAILD